jgi:P2-related tail formation protein
MLDLSHCLGQSWAVRRVIEGKNRLHTVVKREQIVPEAAPQQVVTPSQIEQMPAGIHWSRVR